jgi:hypothetical protein
MTAPAREGGLSLVRTPASLIQRDTQKGDDVCFSLEGEHDVGEHNLEVLPICRTQRFDAEGTGFLPVWG